ncbi:MAG: glycosyltransferase family 9 protein [Planctomycetes bacterium]|nr:glycosyltransferase family 9 protein [Planctomycetota bacterium]
MTRLIRHPLKRMGVAALDLALGPFSKKRPLPASPSRILLCRLDHLGDVLLTTPAIRAVKQRYPESDLHVLVKPWSKPALLHNPYIDQLLCFDADWTRALSGPVVDPLLRERKKLVSHLESARYDIAVDLAGDLRSIRLLAGARPGCLIGPAWKGGRAWLDIEARPDIRSHAVRQNLDVVACMDAKTNELNPQFFPSSDSRIFADRYLSGIPAREGARIILHPGAAHPAKRWPTDRFTELTRRLLKEGHLILALCGPGEEDTMASFMNLTGSQEGLIAMPKMDLDRVGACLERVDAFIGNDTGTAHLAQAVGCRSAVLFGPTDPSRFGPLDLERNRVVQSKHPDAPCWWPETGNRRPKCDLMAEISIDSAHASLLELLKA